MKKEKMKMGAWGVGLYQDDVTCDVKTDYLNWLRVKESNIEATQELIDRNIDFIEDEDDGPLFWFALADVQWNYGRLLLEVKEKAIKCLKEGKNLERWEENPKQYEKRKKILEGLEKKLNSPQPPEKKVSKIKFSRALWNVGDILQYKICARGDERVEKSKWIGKYVLLKIIGIQRYNVGSLPRDIYYNEVCIAAVYSWVGEANVDKSIVEGLEFLDDEHGWKHDKLLFILCLNKNELKKLNFQVLIKDEENINKEDYLMNSVGIGFLNDNIFDFQLVQALDEAEAKGNLVDDTI